MYLYRDNVIYIFIHYIISCNANYTVCMLSGCIVRYFWYIWYTGRTLRAASHHIAPHRITSRRIASCDPSGGPSNAHAPFLDSRLSGFSLRMVGDWPGVTPPYNGFTRPRRVLERVRERKRKRKTESEREREGRTEMDEAREERENRTRARDGGCEGRA